jgi:hypothetical protein
VSDDGKPSAMDDTPEGWAIRWGEEIKAAEDALEKWHKSAQECDDVYRDEEEHEGERLNLYAAGVDLREAMLYGNDPKVDVKRRSNDQDDDDGRVAAEIEERHLNGDLERDEEAYPEALANALKDWLIAGFGMVWLRLERETEKTEAVEAILREDGTEQAPAVPAGEQIISEEVVTEYVYWRDTRWSPARVFQDVRWWARCALLSQATAEKKFGEKLPLTIGANPKDTDDKAPATPWARAKVWEIWDKEHKGVWFWCEGHPKVLKPVDVEVEKNGMQPDPLGLKTFWPFPKPLFNGQSSGKLVPRPPYARAQDLYEAIDDTTRRIGILRGAVKAAGLCDKEMAEALELLNGDDNKIVPVPSFQAITEKGGVANAIAWMPLQPIVQALAELREQRQEQIELLYQVTGDSDIMRGQATAPGTTATEQSIKAKFASIRGDKAQKQFAKFAGGAQKIRGEIICKHFQPETIAERANVASMPPADQQRVPRALEILKSGKADYRISVKPETISLTDYAANKQEAMDVAQGIGGYVQALAPLAGAIPQFGPAFLQILQVLLSRVKGGDSFEPIIDGLVTQLQQAAQMQAQQAAQQGPPPNPQLEVAQVKAAAEKAKAGAEVQKTMLDLHVAHEEHEMDLRRMEAQQRTDAVKAVTQVANRAGGAPG